MRHEKGAKSAAAQFPEFRAWHALLRPLFDIAPPDWTEQILDLDLVQRMHAHAHGTEEDDETEESRTTKTKTRLMRTRGHDRSPA